MKDPALITLLSVVLSALITSAGTVLAAYISKDRKAKPQKQGLLKPKGYDEHKRDGDGDGKRDRMNYPCCCRVFYIKFQTE